MSENRIYEKAEGLINIKNLNSTIAAISTAQGEGGIGIIRISGSRSLEIADKIFKNINNRSVSEMKGYTASFGRIYDEGEEIDEAVVLVFRAPNSYTGENVVEISCHGGIYITKRVLRAVFNAGAIPAEAGEFTERAFLNGKLDLAEAESVMDIISAKSRSAARAALCVKNGSLSTEINAIKDSLLNLIAHLSAWADYPEEDIAEVDENEIFDCCNKASVSLQKLLDGYDGGQAVKRGIDTVIAGSPNVGKSTLMNLLTGCEKSIVTDIPGTTRDIVEETVVLGNVILRLSDTAGLRYTDNAVEKIGVDRAKRRIENCGLLLAVFDNNRRLCDEDKELLKAAENIPSVAVINKNDLTNKLETDLVGKSIKNIVFISALSGEGKEDLIKAVEKTVGTSEFNPSEGILSNERQRLAAANSLCSIKEALSALKSAVTFDAITVLLEDAVSYLTQLTGESVSEEVIDRVFHNFCVGK